MTLHHSQQCLTGIALQLHGQLLIVLQCCQLRQDYLHYDVYATGLCGRYAALEGGRWGREGGREGEREGGREKIKDYSLNKVFVILKL